MGSVAETAQALQELQPLNLQKFKPTLRHLLMSIEWIHTWQQKGKTQLQGKCKTKRVWKLLTDITVWGQDPKDENLIL